MKLICAQLEPNVEPLHRALTPQDIIDMAKAFKEVSKEKQLGYSLEKQALYDLCDKVQFELGIIDLMYSAVSEAISIAEHNKVVKHTQPFHLFQPASQLRAVPPALDFDGLVEVN